MEVFSSKQKILVCQQQQKQQKRVIANFAKIPILHHVTIYLFIYKTIFDQFFSCFCHSFMQNIALCTVFVLSVFSALTIVAQLNLDIEAKLRALAILSIRKSKSRAFLFQW